MSDETVPDLYRLAFIPGAFKCPQCGFVLTKNCINADTGEMGTREQERESELCPNDGTMLVHVTWKDRVEEYDKLLLQYDERLNKALADEHRLDWIENFIQGGVFVTAFELDSGIHLNLLPLGRAEYVLRERKNLREALDEAMKVDWEAEGG
jgi:hypothetical protein